MTQYNTLNKLKSAIKSGTEVNLNLSSNLIGNSNDETNFPHKLLLTNTQFSKVCKALANGSSAHIKFSKNQLSKTLQSGGFISPHDLFIALIEGLYSLSKSIAKESKNIGAKKHIVAFL